MDYLTYTKLNDEIKKTITVAYQLYGQIIDKKITFSYLLEDHKFINELDGYQKECFSMLAACVYMNYENIFSENNINFVDFLDNFSIVNERGMQELEISLDEDYELAEDFLKSYFENKVLPYNEFDIDENSSVYDFIMETFNLLNKTQVDIEGFFEYEDIQKMVEQLQEKTDKEYIICEMSGNIMELVQQIFGTDKPVEFVDSSQESTFLEKRGTYLTSLEYKYPPAVGREDLVKKVAVTLATPTKSVLLVGPPGVGKTAVVYGLAKNIQDGLYMNDAKIVEIPASSLISGQGIIGDFEKNVEQLLSELEKEATTILFIDEIHQIYKMGVHNSDALNMFKKPISEGKLKLIGATTKDEYLDTIKVDKAFSDRFDVYDVGELEDEKIKIIINNRIDYLIEYYGLDTKLDHRQRKQFIEYILLITKKNNRNKNELSYNPRLAIQLLDTMFAAAKINNHQNLLKEDVIYAAKSSTKLREHRYSIPNIFSEEKKEIKQENKILQFRKK